MNTMNDPRPDRISPVLILLLGLAGVLSSCGGGSDGGGGAAADPPAVWDSSDWNGAVWQ